MSVLSEVIYERSHNQVGGSSRKVLEVLKNVLFFAVIFAGFAFRTQILAFVQFYL